MSDSLIQMDSGVQAGMQFWEANAQVAPSTDQGLTITTVKSVNSSGYSASIDSQSSARPESLSDQTCTLKVASQGDTTDFMGQVLTPQPGSQYFDCNWPNPPFNPEQQCEAMLFAPAKEIVDSSTVGTFTFAKTGQTVKAFRRTETQKGVKIMCYTGIFQNFSELPEGETLRDTIVTNDIPSLGSASCGGNSIFIHQKATDSAGKVIYDSYFETLGFH